MRVVGGQVTNQGFLGAFVTKVKKGSIGDTVGGLQEGDEVIAWNGQNLQRLSYDETKTIIDASRMDAVVELVAQRATGCVRASWVRV